MPEFFLKAPPQLPAGKVDRPAPGVNDMGHSEKPMHHAGELAIPDVVAGFFQRVGIILAFVAQRVELGSDDGGVRHKRAAMQVRLERRGVDVVAVDLRVGQVVVPEPLHALPLQEQPPAVIPVGRVVKVVVVGHRIDQQLVVDQQRQFRFRQTDGRGQVPAGAVAAHGKGPVGIAQFLGIVHCPDGGGQAVLKGDGELAFRRQAITHRHHHAVGAGAQLPRRGIGSFQVADDPAAAVEPHQNAPGAIPCGGVNPHRNIAGFGADFVGDGAVFHLAHFRAGGAGAVVHHLPALRNGHFLERLQAQAVELRQHALRLGVEQPANCRRRVVLPAMLPGVLSQRPLPVNRQEFAGFLNRHHSGVNGAGHTEKAVDHSFVLVDFAAADGLQQVAVLVAFVAERVVFGGDDQGARQLRQPGGGFRRVVVLAHIEQAERAGQRIVGIGRIRQILVPVPDHRIPFQVVTPAFFLVGIGVKVAVQGGIDQQLLADGHSAGLGGFDGYGGGQVAAGAVAADIDFRAVPQQFVRVFRRPEGSGVAVVQRAGEPGFGGQAVVHRYDHAAGTGAETAGSVVRRFQVADHPAAAVKPGQDGVGAGFGGRVDADGQRAAGAVDDAVFHIADFDDLPRGVEAALPLPGVFARLLGRNGVRGAQAEVADVLENLLRLWVQRHNASQFGRAALLPNAKR